MSFSKYYDLKRSARMVKQGGHRSLVGGLWDEIGQLYMNLLHEHRLKPNMRVLDIGCGCLRIGVHLVEFLRPGKYFGTDISEDLLRAGYEKELLAYGLQDKLPRRQLVQESDFSFKRFNVKFDIAIASSVFTHLPEEYIAICLRNLAPRMKYGGKFFATFFICDDENQKAGPLTHTPGNVTTHASQDPYHVCLSDIERQIKGLPWTYTYFRNWKHPRNQQMIVFERTRERVSTKQRILSFLRFGQNAS